jgi:hypothetical protein
MTAIFPAIAAFVSIYGLFADPNAVEAKSPATQIFSRQLR